MTAIAKSLIFLGTALIALFAIYNVYTVLRAERVTTQDLLGALAMVGLLLILLGSALRQART